MNEQSFFQWDLVRQPLQGQAFGMGASLLDFSILELRKEKSRDAARSRRGKENYEFYELAKLLPLPAAITSQLDKASIIRLSISYLKLREFSGHGDPPWNRDALPNTKSLKGHGRRRNLTSTDLIDSHQGTHILQSLDGFAFALGNDGRFLYISETVSIYLGLSQVEMTGSSIFDYVHHADHTELAEYLGLSFQNVPHASSPGSTSDEGSAPSTPRPVSPSSPDRVAFMVPDPDRPLERTFCLRMKSTLTKRGVHVRTSGYRVVYVTAQFRPQLCFNLNRKSSTQYLGLVALAIALPPPTVTELRIESDTFIMRLSPNFKVIYCDTMISELSDWISDDVNNRMFYDFCHAGDIMRMRKHHEDLMTKGQILTDYFRLMNKNGGYMWVQLCATTLFSSKTSDEHTILAIIYVLSGILHRGCVMDQNQTSGTSRHVDTEISDQRSDQGSDIDETKQDSFPRQKSPAGDPWDTNVTSSHQIDSLHDSANDLDQIDLDKGQTTDNCLTPDDLIDSQEEAARIMADTLQDKLNQNKPDFKCSRRKAEKPRKRKRDYSIDMEDSVDGNCSMLLSRTLSQDDKMERCSSTSNTSNHNEDYEMSDNSENTLYNCVSEDLSKRSSSTHNHDENRLDSSIGWQNLDDINHNSVASSVKDLEDVMNRHLPVISENGMKSQNDLALQHLGGAINRQRSAIQWAGNGHDTSTLPASNLLRTLYANRESVIRSNTRPYGNNDTVNLLTPPENEGHKEHLNLHIPHIISNKTTALPPYSSSMTSNVSCNLQDTFDITPPASVSPNDKVPLYDGHYDHCNNSSSLAAPIPVKSQAFSLSFVSPSPEYNGGTKVHPSSYQVTEHPQFVYGGSSSSGSMYDSWY